RRHDDRLVARSGMPAGSAAGPEDAGSTASGHHDHPPAGANARRRYVGRAAPRRRLAGGPRRTDPRSPLLEMARRSLAGGGARGARRRPRDPGRGYALAEAVDDTLAWL